jgi:hypothetical protein
LQRCSPRPPQPKSQPRASSRPERALGAALMPIPVGSPAGARDPAARACRCRHRRSHGNPGRAHRLRGARNAG